MIQIFVNGLLAAGTACVAGLGFALIYRTANFFHFSHGAVITSGAYFAFCFRESFDFGLAVAIPLAIAGSTVLGVLLEVSVYRRLRHQQATPLVAMLASLGIYIVVQNLVSLLFGDETKTLRKGPIAIGMNFFGASLTGVQVGILVISVVLPAVVLWWIRISNLGKAMRAVANDPLLAQVCGVDSDRIILWAFGIGSALAGVAGLLIALDVDMTPTMGMNAMMLGMVACIIGGMGRLAGVLLGALVLGLAQQFAVWFMGAEWQGTITFVVLFVFLLCRPQGFLGARMERTVRRTTL